ncbi:hypothetical protein DL93DRAFT_2102492 [Clavulina sp. PMI_390]|nr:hypothetical protein DL93DRAFT_2102492 [Clavulina sp. PMI_390]
MILTEIVVVPGSRDLESTLLMVNGDEEPNCISDLIYGIRPLTFPDGSSAKASENCSAERRNLWETILFEFLRKFSHFGPFLAFSAVADGGFAVTVTKMIPGSSVHGGL